MSDGNSLCFKLIVLSPCPLLPVAVVLEHGEQRHMQRPTYHGVKALLQSGPLQQADDKCPTHLSAGHNHREQDCGPYWHFHWTPASGIHPSWMICFWHHSMWPTINNHLLYLFWQLVLTRSSPIIFANYSLEENQRVSSIAAVYSSEYLLFVAGDKVQRHDNPVSLNQRHAGQVPLRMTNELASVTLCGHVMTLRCSGDLSRLFSCLHAGIPCNPENQ